MSAIVGVTRSILFTGVNLRSLLNALCFYFMDSGLISRRQQGTKSKLEGRKEAD